jgi:hypothetical protein
MGLRLSMALISAMALAQASLARAPCAGWDERTCAGGWAGGGGGGGGEPLT